MKYFVVIVLLLIGCKLDNKNQDIKADPIEKEKILEKKNFFTVEMDVLASKDDIFEFFYTDLSEDEGFSENKKLRKRLIGSESTQKVIFEVPNEIVPYRFRIDLGNNVEQSEITIKEIVLRYNENSIIIKNTLIDSFFIINKYVNLNQTTGEATLLKVENRRDPFIISKPILIKKIEIEL